MHHVIEAKSGITDARRNVPTQYDRL